MPRTRTSPTASALAARLSRAARKVNSVREAYEADARALRDALGVPCPHDIAGAYRWASDTSGAASKVELRARLLADAVGEFFDAQRAVDATRAPQAAQGAPAAAPAPTHDTTTP